MKKKLLILTMIMAGGYASLDAQEYATDKSIREQIVNNKQPGAVYAPTGVNKQTPSKTFVGSSLKKQIEEGKLGMSVKSATGSVTQTVKTNRPAGLVLPSEVTPEQRQAELNEMKTEANRKAIEAANSQVVEEVPKSEKLAKSDEQKPAAQVSKTKTD